MIDRSLDLPAGPQAPGRARRELRAACAAAGTDEDVAETGVLLADEVVTNAVLHGREPVRLRATAGPAWVRVEVDDGSDVLPSARQYGSGATTGRGLGLVEVLAAGWGVVPLEGGKRVWFEVGPVPGEGRGAAADGPVGPDEHPVVLRNAPVHLVCAAIEYADAVLREVALLALGGNLHDLLPGGWAEPPLSVDPIVRAVARVPPGTAHADLAFTVDGAAREAATERIALVDLADRLAHDGRLLAAPALPEVTDARKWMLTEIAHQVGGAPPRAWRPPRGRDTGRAPAVLPRAELGRLGALDAAAVVVDDGDLVVWANAAAEDVLGRTALVGERAVALLPPEARDAHVAALTRRQLGGHLADRTETRTLAVVRADGSPREVRVVITERRAVGDRRAYEVRLLAGG